jgi:Zn-dependent M28 family amino/carboxypeptidase
MGLRQTITPLLAAGLVLLALQPAVGSAQSDTAMDNIIHISEDQLRATVSFLTRLDPPRSFDSIPSLDAAADYIHQRFEAAGLQPWAQTYRVDNVEVKNVVASVGRHHPKRFIVGAHYDVFGKHDGADDNASGIAGLLSLAELLHQHRDRLRVRIDLVAFTLEEPPFFGTAQMGSHVHAESVARQRSAVIGMAALEMIGYFTSVPNSQKFPLSVMKYWYPTTGDFIAVVSNFGSTPIKNHFKKHMRRAAVKVETLTAPALVPGVDFSDHRNYWKQGIKAVMITDTAFYRNPNYHTPADTIDTLDFGKMKAVVHGVFLSLIHLEG